MGKYFPDTARHAKAQEFLELKQGTMTVIEYVARFTELACFANDYVAMDMAKVRRFENGLKLSIRGRIVGLCLQDMDSMVGIALTIEREIEDARSTRGAGVSSKRKESQSSSSSGKKKRASSSCGFQDRGHPGQGWIRGASISFKELHGHLPLHRQAREARLWAEAEDKAHRQGCQGFRGVSTPSHHRLSQRISQLYRVCFSYLAYEQECYLILVLRIHLSLHQL